MWFDDYDEIDDSNDVCDKSISFRLELCPTVDVM